jgi:aminopeptidase N
MRILDSRKLFDRTGDLLFLPACHSLKKYPSLSRLPQLIAFIFFAEMIACQASLAQKDSAKKFTHADTLRGMLTPARSCYDVTFYDLDLRLDMKKRTVTGTNTISFVAMQDFDSLQVDLFARMKIEKIVFEGTELKYRRELDAVFIKFPSTQGKGKNGQLIFYYSGMPRVALSPPWDGGFVWKKDPQGRDWVGVACQGTGASLWWPCKDHLSDEPDSMQMRFTIPTGLMCVGNGTLKDTMVNKDGTTSWTWFVHYPINSYNVTINIADYAHLHDEYISGSRHLDLDYYVLKDNTAKAEHHFSQVKIMMACFEKYFGPYPFWNDGFAMVETNYWGMEHQGAIAYGNNYENNKQGFDFIIIHESAHEWWGNNVSCSDNADLWIHESFATYAEALYMECTQGYESAINYLKELRWKIADKHPIIGPYDVNFDGTTYDNDQYYKGSWMLHTFRSVLNNDTLFFGIIKDIQQHFALKTTDTDELIAFISKSAGNDYAPFFSQYLRYTAPPVLEYKAKQRGKDTKLEYRWKTDVNNFSMPVEVTSFYSYSFGKEEKKFMRIDGTQQWQTITIPGFKAENFDVNTDRFYVKKQKVK